MRKSDSQSIGEVLSEYIKSMRIDSRLQEQKVIKLWPELMGPAIEKVTKKVYLKEGKLYVELSSSVARNELLMMREGIITVLNKRVGGEIVKEIVLK